MLRNILIYKNSMLAYSETFIIEQGESLTNFLSVYLCSRKVDNGLMPPRDRFYALSNNTIPGKIKEILFLYGLNITAHLKKIEEICPHIIHAHFGVDGSFLVEISRKLSLPLITTFHGYDITINKQNARSSFLAHRLYHNRQANLARYGDCFIAVSDFVKQKLIDNGFPENKIVKHYIGVDTKKFIATVRKPKKNHIVFVGRLVEKKGTLDLLEAFKEVKKQLDNVSLTIIGDGPLRLKLEEFVNINHLNDVTFTGRQTQAEVKEYLASASIFCVPSKTAANGDSEAFGIVFIEAQAMGIPVVSYHHGGIPEAVSHGKTGLLAEEGNTKELAQHITFLLKNDSVLLDFSNNAIEYVKENYCLHKQSKKLEEIYESVIKNHNRKA